MKRHNIRVNYRKNSQVEYTLLEDRSLLAAFLFVDFGDNFPGGALNTTTGAFNLIAGAVNPNDQIWGPATALTDSSENYSPANPLRLLSAPIFEADRAYIMNLTRRAFLPLDVNVVELTAEPQTLSDGRVVAGARESNLSDVVTMLRSGNPASRDGYVFVTPAIVAPGLASEFVYDGVTRLGGVAPSSDVVSGANLRNDVAFTFTQRDGLNTNRVHVAQTIVHEGGHLFGVDHAITNFSNNPATTLFHEAEVMSYVTKDPSFMFTRYPMIRGEDNSPELSNSVFVSPVNYNDLASQNSNNTIFDQLRNDPNVGANPNFAFVSGTGAHDIITLTKNGNFANVTVQAFADVNYVNAITVPGQTTSVYSYTIPLTNTILIYAGGGNDRIIVDADLGVDIQVEGMRGSDELIVRGKGVATATYTPGNTGGIGLDLVQDLRGELRINGRTISVSNFDTAGMVRLENVQSTLFRTPAGRDTVYVNTPTPGHVEISGLVGSGFMIPFRFTNIATFNLDVGFGDNVIGESDSVNLGQVRATGLTAFNVLMGAGNDFLSIRDDFDANQGVVSANGGSGVNSVFGPWTVSTWSLTESRAGLLNNELSFNSFDRLIGGSEDDTFRVESGAINMSLDGGGGSNSIFGPNLDRTWDLTSDYTGQLRTSNVTFERIQEVIGGSQRDVFNVGVGVVGIEVDGGAGVDRIVGPNLDRTWQLTGLRHGHLATSDINFVGIEEILGGSIADTFVLGGVAIGMTIDGGGGANSVHGPNQDRTWILDGNRSGRSPQSAIDFLRINSIFGGNAGDVFRVEAGAINMSVDGGGGSNSIFGPNLDRTWDLTNGSAGLLRTSNVTFNQIQKVIGGSQSDVFNVGVGVLGIEVDGGAGVDRIVGPNLDRTWQLTGLRQGRLATSNVHFVRMEEIYGGTADDRFILAPGALNITINGRGGTDSIMGPDLSRTYTITSAMQGSVSVSNIQFSQVEDLIGGDKLDRFVFTTASSRVRFINGGEGQDVLDFSALGRVRVNIQGLGDDAGAHGFRGQVTRLEWGFRNIGQIMGSQSALNDELTGVNMNSNWFYRPARSIYQAGGRQLSFWDFESLIGGNQQDSFVVRAPDVARLTIEGGDPTTLPGDRLKIQLDDVVNPQWTYVAPGVGRFSFDNKMPVFYSGIETLDMFDWGDAPASYGTLLADNGPRHRLGTPLRLGIRLDPEVDGQPNADATGDDNLGTPNDEDGVVLPTTLIAHFRAAANVYASMAGKLDAWVDFNRDGTFSTSERIANALHLNAGWNRVEFYVPWESSVDGLTIARFRISSHGGLAPTGLAEDGEVEDHIVRITRMAPGTSTVLSDPFYPGTNQTMLVMAGTEKNDTIVVNPNNKGEYLVRINGKLTSVVPAAGVNRVGAYGLEGNDTIVVTSTMLTPSELYGDDGDDDLFGGAADDYIRGGNGNDRLFGHQGNDILFGDAGDDKLYGHEGDDILSGGEGNDRLFGGKGLDLLFGGSGADWLYGQMGEDVLVGNMSDFDNNAPALMRFRTAWQSSSSYATRVDQIRSGSHPALSGLRLHFGTTVHDDEAKDRFFGGRMDDWFVGLGLFDEILDRSESEMVS
ncbi:MAG: hypothetical protein KF851_10335 [Pirellulaceae bacterium]|nr:hypothetical protein [Pirellulaceae bacterium]